MEISKENILMYSCLTLVGGLAVLGGYAKVWEYKQPEEAIKHTIVTKIQPYSYSPKGDLSRVLNGNKISVCGENREINFSLECWNKDVRVGDLVDLTFKQRSPLLSDELRGISIGKDSKD